MNPDTIFPALKNNERIIRKFSDHSSSKQMKFIAILTNHRLLIRTKQNICCCFCCQQSSYSAISLESIHRIDEYHASPNTGLYSIIWIFWLLATITGILVSIFFAENQTIKIIGIIISIIPLIIMSITILSCLCCCFKRKGLKLNGTFGSLEFFLEENQARLFESYISEQILQSKLRFQLPNYSLLDEILVIDRPKITSSRF